MNSRLFSECVGNCLVASGRWIGRLEPAINPKYGDRRVWDAFRSKYRITAQRRVDRWKRPIDHPEVFKDDDGREVFVAHIYASDDDLQRCTDIANSRYDLIVDPEGSWYNTGATTLFAWRRVKPMIARRSFFEWCAEHSSGQSPTSAFARFWVANCKSSRLTASSYMCEAEMAYRLKRSSAPKEFVEPALACWKLYMTEQAESLAAHGDC